MLKKLANAFPHADKVLHFLVGALVASFILLLFREPWFGFACAMLVGYGLSKIII